MLENLPNDPTVLTKYHEYNHNAAVYIKVAASKKQDLNKNRKIFLLKSSLIVLKNLIRSANQQEKNWCLANLNAFRTELILLTSKGLNSAIDDPEYLEIRTITDKIKLGINKIENLNLTVAHDPLNQKGGNYVTEAPRPPRPREREIDKALNSGERCSPCCSLL
ncbi:MAG: hypothetical protein ACK4PR_08170 [Gammaproteobacteria bacterium]